MSSTTMGGTVGRVLGGALAALALSGPALAQEDIPEGTVVRVKGVHAQDAYFRNRKDIIGLACGVEEGGLHFQGKKKWYGGSMTCEDGQNYYFYMVAIEPDAYGTPYEAVTGHPVGKPPGSDSPWQIGARVQVRDVSAEDAHVKDKARIVGQTCTVADAPLESTGADWFSGQLNCDNGSQLYFYQVSVAEPGTVQVTTAASAGVATTAASDFPAGKMVKIVEVAPADALFASKDALIGRVCSVVESPLVPTGEGFYAGRLFCDDGKSYQPFKVKVAAQ